MMPFRVTLSDGRLFADLSGDYNPLHLDAVAARRTLFGRAAPHGIHVLLKALDNVALAPPASIAVVFGAPCRYDEDIEAIGSSDRLSVIQGQFLVQTVTFAGSSQTAFAVPSGGHVARAPQDLRIDAAAHARGSVALRLDRDLCALLFPNLVTLWSSQKLAILLAATRIVGMECPGLNSVFATLSLSFRPGMELAYEVTRVDRRMDLIKIGLSGAAVGEITALFRRPPTQQPSVAEVAEVVGKGEFAEQTALVIGGSRGLGETTAKILAAGGAEVGITYVIGRNDAERVQNEIRAQGGSCRIFQFDVTAPAPIGWNPSHLYYLATPPIRSTKAWDEAMFRQYCDFYVSGLKATLDTCQGITHLFLPSTAFIDDPSTPFKEYVAAKVAGETAAAQIAEQRGLRLATKRLPPLRTDQTGSIRGRPAADPLPALLAALRDI